MYQAKTDFAKVDIKVIKRAGTHLLEGSQNFYVIYVVFCIFVILYFYERVCEHTLIVLMR